MNDIKTLYDVCSDKDELAQIAKKLGIKDNVNLSTILNEIIDAIPEGGGAEPFIVEGCQYENGEEKSILASLDFQEDAIDAFKQGRTILFHVIYDMGSMEEIDEWSIAVEYKELSLFTYNHIVNFGLM